ncbi:head-tail connector protein [Acinetobacter guillouiae]|uniref:head-tail connector protein n=1 Tax=Acinetobacter guillouiae TaxID=106649 RepID=UPI0028E74684|nr:head-tail connector protein [Acinetobacter guillouiae]
MITLEKAKLQCRVDHDDEDELFQEWISEAEEEIEKDLDRKIIVLESDRQDETDVVDCKKLDNARILYIQYKYSRSLDEKPRAYWDTLRSLRNIGV